MLVYKLLRHLDETVRRSTERRTERRKAGRDEDKLTGRTLVGKKIDEVITRAK